MCRDAEESESLCIFDDCEVAQWSRPKGILVNGLNKDCKGKLRSVKLPSTVQRDSHAGACFAAL